MNKENEKKELTTESTDIDRNELVDISTVKINTDLPVKERIQDFIRQIKDPYHYIDHGIKVTIKFSGKKRFDECLKDALFARDII